MMISTDIVLVEEDDKRLDNETRLLLDIGYSRVRQAKTGMEAWAALKSYPVDIIVSSWALPELDGLALLKVIRTDPLHSDLPFLIMVEEVTKQQVLQAGQAGVTDMILRPVTKKKLKEKITAALAGEQDERRLESKKNMKLGEALMRQGKLEEALACFHKVIEVSEYAEVYYNMGYIRVAQGKYEEAILAFRKATEINSDFAQAYKKLGEVYGLLGRHEESEACYEKAAEIFIGRDMDKEAEQVFFEAFKYNPQTINVYNSLGILYRRRGKLEESIRMYRKALRVNPDDETVQYNLARVYTGVNNYTEAAKILRKTLSANPGFSEAADLLKSIEMGEYIEKP